MFDSRVEATIRGLLHARFQERQRPVQHETTQALFEASSAGRLGSSSHARSTIRIFEDELGLRGEYNLNITIDTLRRLKINLGSHAKDDLMSFFRSIVVEQREALQHRLMELSPFKRAGTRYPGPMLDPASYLDGAQGLALQKIEAQIDLLLLEAGMATDVPVKSSPALASTINVSGNNNVVIAGTSERSTISVNLTTDARQSICDALYQLDEALEKGVTVPGVETHELRELSKRAQEEAKKDTPNKLSLKSTLSEIGNVIRTTGALKPAYDSIKAALGYFGVTLP